MPRSWPFGYEGQASVWAFWVCPRLLAFWVAGFFSSKPRIYEAKRKTQASHHRVIPQVPRSQPACLLSTLRSPLTLVVIDHVQGLRCLYYFSNLTVIMETFTAAWYAELSVRPAWSFHPCLGSIAMGLML